MDRVLEELIAIPSVSGNHEQCDLVIDYIEQRLRPHGLHIQRFAGNGYPSLVATTQPSKTPKVLLYAHLDVVGGPAELFKLRLAGGKYYGRGVLDMKSIAAAYLHILEDIRPALDSYDIGLMFTTDEESHGTDGAGMLVEQGFLPQVSIMPDSSFGTQWQLEATSKGCWFATISAVGISAHGSKPWEGDSASIKLIRALNEIVALFDDAQRPDTATLNIGILGGGKSVNQIPAEAMATIDVRFPDYDQFLQIRQAIWQICDRYGLEIKTTREADGPFTCDLNHPLIKAFARHITLQTGVTPQPYTANGTSDARFFLQRGIPCVLTSPPGGEAHGQNEWLSAEGYEQFKLILRAYLDEVAKLTGSSSENPRLAVVPAVPKG